MFNGSKDIIAIVDSGIGGVSVLKKLLALNRFSNFIYFADNLNMPYGNKSKKFLSKRLDYIIDLLKNKYKASKIIIACNTASTILDETKYKDVFILNFDKSKTYYATTLTKKNLKTLNVISDNSLARQIENYILDDKKLEKIIKKHIKKHKIDELDEIVLGCTHYELVIDIFKKHCKHTRVLTNVDRLIENFLNSTISQGEQSIAKSIELNNVFFLQTKNSKSYIDKLKKLIGR